MNIHSIMDPGAFRRRVAFLGAFSLLALFAQLTLAASASAAPLSGTFGPAIVSGRADVNGDGLADAADDSAALYGDTAIIDGQLDCNGWGAVPNDGTGGDGVIDAADDCSMVAYDGSTDGVTIAIIDGQFDWPNAPYPRVFNAAQPGNPDIGDSDFAWSAIGGRVDSNGNEVIDANGDDCSFGLVGQANVLGNDAGGTNPCGFAVGPNSADNGLVDLNGNQNPADDTCAGCFFGRDVQSGFVQAGPECPGYKGDRRIHIVGTFASDILSGTPGGEIMCGLAGNDVLRGRDGDDIQVGGQGRDSLRGGRGSDLQIGGEDRDVLRGHADPDQLFGKSNNDDLFGGGGADLLNGGAGWGNACVGGPGSDSFLRCDASP